MLLGLFRTRALLEAENLALRHQLNVLRRRSPKRAVFSNFDRLFFVCLYRLAPRILDALAIVEPETVIRWHRAGFRTFWRWRSRRRAGRPLAKDSPFPRSVQAVGSIFSVPILGGLHQHYVRI